MSDAVTELLREEVQLFKKIAHMSDHQLFLAIKAETAEYNADCHWRDAMHCDEMPAKPRYLRCLEEAAIHRLDPSG